MKRSNSGLLSLIVGLLACGCHFTRTVDDWAANEVRVSGCDVLDDGRVEVWLYVKNVSGKEDGIYVATFARGGAATGQPQDSDRRVLEATVFLREPYPKVFFWESEFRLERSRSRPAIDRRPVRKIDADSLQIEPLPSQEFNSQDLLEHGTTGVVERIDEGSERPIRLTFYEFDDTCQRWETQARCTFGNGVQSG